MAIELFFHFERDAMAPHLSLAAADLNIRFIAAAAVVREAGKLSLNYFHRRTEIAIESKGLQDLVSSADRATEDLIVRELSRLFPDDGFLGEEGGHRGGEGALWVIDPIDGTANFLRGIPFWCISLALVINNEAVIGVIYDPNADELFTARHGKGAFRNGQKMKVSGRTDPKQARMSLGFSYRADPKFHVSGISKFLNAGIEYSRLASGALSMAYVADGRFDGYWEKHINSWDVLAGLVLVQEAGGWISDFLANDGLTKGNEILAATPALAEFFSKTLSS
ncbi:MAG: inositol monophosphatase family protein [Alphaproteobacteria bacterium]